MSYAYGSVRYCFVRESARLNTNWSGSSGRLRRGHGLARWIVAHLIQLRRAGFASEIKLLLFLFRERPRAAAAEDAELVSVFIHGAVAIQAGADGECRAFGLKMRN